MIDSIYILQPPVLQLNGPYPSGAYLSAFFRTKEARALCPSATVCWIDVNNRLFRRLFSAAGLSRLFDLSAKRAATLEGEAGIIARRFYSERERWQRWIGTIVSILCGSDRELTHALMRSPQLPRGPRLEAFLAGLDVEGGPDEARMLATVALEDIADYITAVYDSEFSLVRYAESIAASERSFSKIEGALDRPLVRDFFEPLMEELLDGIDAEQGPGTESRPTGKKLFCISIPFPGCMVHALAMARALRRRYGSKALIAFGGGYVNTELRSCASEQLFSYIDCLGFDRGYGALLSILQAEKAEVLEAVLPRRLFCPEEFRATEARLTANLVPDYDDIDFSLYPRLADTHNPMHRLWSDGAWLKAYLAHGCYWHRCSFCDVSLDYIRAYKPVNVPALFTALRAQADRSGVHGVHFVDEAAPPRALRDFALANLGLLDGGGDGISAASGSASFGGGNPPALPLSFWGNIRFEKTFTRDLADLLAAGGLVGVSGGIEIASPEGFKAVDKGIDLENLVAVCAAFKEAGVLVHSYLIYGYWNESDQEVVDSAEVMRQLFAAGLVDSAFWHKFVLTRHSRVYGEWQRGLHQQLRPVESSGDFADNDLRFAGEEKSARFSAPLDAALQAWMAGESLEKPVRSWFPFSVPSPRIERDLIESYIARYESARDRDWRFPCESAASYYWAASLPVRDGSDLVWWHRGEEVRLAVNSGAAKKMMGLFSGESTLFPGSALAWLDAELFRALRANGLVRV